MNKPVIEVKNLSKKFCSNLRKSMFYGLIDLSKNIFSLGLLKTANADLRSSEFWALSDVNFELNKGEVLGILGQNGSGKSTLLRMINSIFPPDLGEITVRGRLGSLIALGAGFHPHMTGIENIFLNASILGMTKDEINIKLKLIVEFADIGDFLNAPVSTYSSGMTVRLGFAIAIHSDIDVLIIDEVLAVGDINFQRKCFDKIYELKNRGISIILVTHSTSTVERMCSRALVLEKGKVVHFGAVTEAIRQYNNLCNRDLVLKAKRVEPDFKSYGAGKVVISEGKAYELERPGSGPEICFGKDFVIDFEYEFQGEKADNNELRLGIRTPEGRDVQLLAFHEGRFADGKSFASTSGLKLSKKGRVKVKIQNQRFFPQMLKVDISISRMDRDYHEGGRESAVVFQIIQPSDQDLYFESGTMMVTRFENSFEHFSL